MSFLRKDNELHPSVSHSVFGREFALRLMQNFQRRVSPLEVNILRWLDFQTAAFTGSRANLLLDGLKNFCDTCAYLSLKRVDNTYITNCNCP